MKIFFAVSFLSYSLLSLASNSHVVNSHSVDISNSYFVDVAETSEEINRRLINLSNTYEKFKIKPSEKFVYAGGMGSESKLEEMQVLYRDYSGDKDEYIYIAGDSGNGYKLNYSSRYIRKLPIISDGNYSSRVSPRVLERDYSSPAVKYYGDKYDEYHRRNVAFAQKVIKYGACDTVIYVDVYDFGNRYLNAVCGDRREVKQSLNDYNSNKPISDIRIKETYLIMPKNELDALRNITIK